MKISPGTLLNNRFLILSELGEGGFAVVYRAEDRELGREVALKVLKPFAASESELMARFQREAKYLGQLNCENIVGVFAYGLVDNRDPFICMELLKGRSLKALISSAGAMDFKQTKFVLEQTCRGLLHAHEAGLVHRDLSPANLFIADKGKEQTIKILDFGLSRLYESENPEGEKLTGTGVLMGNPPYMSPEQAAGHKPDRRSDIYSLGCTLYECLTGRAPFEADTPLGVLYLQQNEYPEEPQLLWEDKLEEEVLKYITLRCLQKQPENRFQSCDEILNTLSSNKIPALTGLNIWKSGKKQNDRSKAAVLLALILLAAIVPFTAFLLQSSRHRDSSSSISVVNKNVSSSPAVELANLTVQLRGQIFGSSSVDKLKEISAHFEALIPRLQGHTSKQFVAYMLLSDVYQALGEFEKEKKCALASLAICRRADGSYCAEAVESLMRLCMAEQALKDHKATKDFGLKTIEMIDLLRANPKTPTLGVPNMQFGMHRLINIDGIVCKIMRSESLHENDLKAAEIWARRDLEADEFRGDPLAPGEALDRAELWLRNGNKKGALELIGSIRQTALATAELRGSPRNKQQEQQKIEVCLEAANWYGEHNLIDLEKKALEEAKSLCHKFNWGKQAPYPEILERLKK